jgi:hypothetical protein
MFPTERITRYYEICEELLDFQGLSWWLIDLEDDPGDGLPPFWSIINESFGHANGSILPSTGQLLSHFKTFKS